MTVTLEELKKGIPMQCELVVDDNQQDVEIQIIRKYIEDSLLTSVQTNLPEMQKNEDVVIQKIEKAIAEWFEQETPLPDLQYVLKTDSKDGSFVLTIEGYQKV